MHTPIRAYIFLTYINIYYNKHCAIHDWNIYDNKHLLKDTIVSDYGTYSNIMLLKTTSKRLTISIRIRTLSKVCILQQES